MNNLDGTTGPTSPTARTASPPSRTSILLGFDFGEHAHVCSASRSAGSPTTTSCCCSCSPLVILVFVRLNNSRIGRGWVAIREDEKAAEAMGINIFGLKLFAFAGGAFLAGVAGTVKAHVRTSSVTPDQYVFLESALPAGRDRARRHGHRARRRSSARRCSS